MAHSHVLLGATETPVSPTVRKITVDDLRDALRQGYDDFLTTPTHAIMLCAIYPLIGLFAARLAFGYSVLPMLYPLASGFALLGPVAALALYEMSRRREQGLDADISHSFDVLRSSSFGAIVAIAFLLLALFGLWVATANAIYIAHFGDKSPDSIMGFVRDVMTTSNGWSMIVIGNLAGLCFAIAALTVSAVSFPLLLDRDVGAVVALQTSVRVVRENPVTMAIWGLIVGALLVLGSIPAFVGLAVVIPVLGHATWHLYRKAVVADASPHPVIQPESNEHRSAADFPAALFPWK